MRKIKAAALILAVLLAAQVGGSASTSLSKSDPLYADLLPHFAAMEVPDLFVSDVREFFRRFR